jgi:hypothetical protein
MCQFFQASEWDGLKFLCIFVMFGRVWHFVKWVFEYTVLNTNFQETGLESREAAVL